MPDCCTASKCRTTLAGDFSRPAAGLCRSHGNASNRSDSAPRKNRCGDPNEYGKGIWAADRHDSRGNRRPATAVDIAYALSAVRAPVERSVARLKSWRIFRGARRSPDRPSSTSAAVLTLGASTLKTLSGRGPMCPVGRGSWQHHGCERHPDRPAAAARSRRGLPSTGAAGTQGDPVAPPPRRVSATARQFGPRAAVVAWRLAVAVPRRPA
jgi:hypothetical protein